eukprot:snap_masked-scaffold_14-processed-gene-7.53-mRNA-1 protein AED:1.00 eAED:1.00 QI:0/-1/0/0/-1/1/1/0/159
MSILRGSLTNDDKHLIDTSSGVMEAYQKIKELHVEDIELESFTLLSKMEGLRCKEMGEYIKKFKKLLTKFTSIGGKRDYPSIKIIFLRAIQMQKRLYKNKIRPKSDIDPLLRYFQDINNRDFSFNNITKTTNSSSKKFSKLSKLSTKTSEGRQLKSSSK